MGMKTTFLVQTFVLKRKRLAPGDREVASTGSGAESGALKKAEAMVARLPSTAALKWWPTTRPASCRAQRPSIIAARCRTTLPRGLKGG